MIHKQFIPTIFEKILLNHGKRNPGAFTEAQTYRVFWVTGAYCNPKQTEQIQQLISYMEDFFSDFLDYAEKKLSYQENIVIDLQLLTPSIYSDSLNQVISSAKWQNLIGEGKKLKITLHNFQRQGFYLEDVLFLHQLAQECCLGIFGPNLGDGYDIHKTLLSALSGLLTHDILVNEDCFFPSLLTLRDSLIRTLQHEENRTLQHEENLVHHQSLNLAENASIVTSQRIEKQPASTKLGTWTFAVSPERFKTAFQQEYSRETVNEIIDKFAVELVVL